MINFTKIRSNTNLIVGLAVVMTMLSLTGCAQDKKTEEKSNDPKVCNFRLYSQNLDGDLPVYVYEDTTTGVLYAKNSVAPGSSFMFPILNADGTPKNANDPSKEEKNDTDK